MFTRPPKEVIFGASENKIISPNTPGEGGGVVRVTQKSCRTPHFKDTV